MKARNRLGAVVLMTAGLVVGMASAAMAHTVGISIDCDSVNLSFVAFANKPGNTATVNINGSAHTVTWTGPSRSTSFPIDPSDGSTVVVNVSWNTNGHQGAASKSQTMQGCDPEETPTPTPPPSTTPPAQPPAQPPQPPTQPPTEVAAEQVATEVKGETTKPNNAEPAPAAPQPEAVSVELAFTGPRDQIPVIGVMAGLFLVTGLVLLRVERRAAERS